MDRRLMEEEKKDGKGEIRWEGKEVLHDNEGNEDDETEVEELGDLPPEIAQKIGKDRCFKSEEELESALVEAGVGDLRVVLINGKPRLIMPSDQHNQFTGQTNLDFQNRWAKNRWGASVATHKIYLQDGKSRDPDLSFWGYPRCVRDSRGNLNPIFGSVPDVIIQFSWKNKADYEVNAINDMMNQALEKDHGDLSTTRPTLGYLIKVRFSRKRKLPGARKGSQTQDMVGLDIYRLAHGTTVDDARDSTNPRAQHWQFAPGGHEVFITITPQELGITGGWAWLCGEYKIKASDIFDEMQNFHQNRQREGLAT